MTLKKTMTEKALAANRANGSGSPGPRNTTFTKINAVKHGILTRQLHFRSDEEKVMFNELHDELVLHYAPVGPTERELVSEVGLCFWRLSEVYAWELDEVIHRRNVVAAISRALRNSGDIHQAELLKLALKGWEAEEMLVRSGNRTSEEIEDFREYESGKSSQLSIEAKLTPALATVTRYGAAIRRDLYRALAALHELRRQRFLLNPGLVVNEKEGADARN